MTEEEDPMEAPPELEDLVRELKHRFQFVVTLTRHGLEEMDSIEKQAFAFVIGGTSDNALIMEGGVDADGRYATCRVWGLQNGQKVQLSALELSHEYQLSLPLDPQ